MELVVKKNGKLVKANSELINLECESYLRQDGKAKFEVHKKICANTIYRKSYTMVAVSAAMSELQIIDYLKTKYKNLAITRSTTDKEMIAKEEGLEDLLQSVPKLTKVEFTTFIYTSNCIEDDVCDCNI